MASMQATKKTIWMTKIMKELRYMKEKKAMVIHCDNQGAISLMKNPTQNVQTKHIDVQHHFVQKQIENGKIMFEYCSTGDMVVNVFTKALPKE
jgi:predicted lipase